MSTIRLPSRSRRWPLIVIGVLVLLAILFTALSGAVVDLLWYREIGQSSVFWTTIRTRFLLGLVFGLLFFGLLYANLIIARRIRPTTRIMTPDQEVLARVRDASDPYLRWLVPVGAAILALLVGIGVSGEWKTFLLWRGGSGIMFGNPDPLFHRDPSFYIFTMPWLRFLQGWLFSSLVGVTIIVGVAHLLWGGIRPQAPMFADKVTPAARAHLSVLLGLIMLVKAWGYWLGRYDLLTSSRGVVEGASYTDVNAQLPALTFLTIVAVICAILFFLNIRLRQWSLPVIAVGLLLLVSVLLGTAYPSFVQQFRVKPNEQSYETPYIDRNIKATNEAFALNTIQSQQHKVTGPLTAQQIQDNSGTVSNIRVWRGVPILEENFQSPPAAAPVLQLRRRRRRSLQDRRPGAGVDGLAARDRPGGARAGGADVAQPAPDLHARLRRRGRAGEHRDVPGAAGVPAPGPAAGDDRRSADDEAARDLLRREQRRAVRRHEHEHHRGQPAGWLDGAVRRQGRHPTVELHPASDVRLEVPRLQPAGLQQHHVEEQDPDLPRHPDADP